MENEFDNHIRIPKIPGYQEILDEMDGVAKEATLVSGITEVSEKIDNFYDTFDADISSQLSEITGYNTESGITGTSQSEEQISNLRTLQESINSLATDINALKNAHVINNVNVGGITFMEGIPVDATALSIAMNKQKILEIEDNVTVHADVMSGSFEGLHNCYYIRMNNLQSIPGMYQFGASITRYASAYFPSATSFSGGITASPKLKILDIRNLYLYRNAITTTQAFPLESQDINLIDIYFGANLHLFTSATVPYLKNWSPTEALRTDVSTLVDDGETFSNNLEKLLYNIRTHIVEFLPDLTGQTPKTMMFHANVKAAIQAEASQETANAFAAKNWYIAS